MGVVHRGNGWSEGAERGLGLLHLLGAEGGRQKDQTPVCCHFRSSLAVWLWACILPSLGLSFPTCTEAVCQPG